MSASTRKKDGSSIERAVVREKKSAAPQPVAGERQKSRRSSDYLSDTLRPFVCLVFVIPILLTYELGTILIGNESIRSGIDVWANSLFGWIGAGQLFLLPILMTVVLMYMHHAREDRFGFHPSVITGMTIESFALALIVFCGAKAQLLFLTPSVPTFPAMWINATAEPSTGGAVFSIWPNLVAFCGAGLYEELLFRLLMIPAAMVGLTKLGLKRIPAATIAIVVTSLLFASLHYQILNPAGLPLEWAGFMARFIASVFFCLVFLFRGFGVAVGTHVAYDVLTLL